MRASSSGVLLLLGLTAASLPAQEDPAGERSGLSPAARPSERVVLSQASRETIHEIDIAFIYPGSLARNRLQKHTRAAVQRTNVILARSGVNARLRTVAVEPDRRYDLSLDGVGLSRAVRLMTRALPAVRADYGADLLYALTSADDAGACGMALVRRAGEDKAFAARQKAAGAIFYGNGSSDQPCIGDNPNLAHQVGHNLGLLHEVEDDPGEPFVPYGRAYRGKTAGNLPYVTVMGIFGAKFARFSTDSRHEGLQMGSGQANAAKALLHTIEDASNYAPTRITEPPPDHECTADPHSACLQGGRFRVEATASWRRPSGEAVDNRKARVREAMLNGTDRTASLFWFFTETNPELLVKVVDGCGVNRRFWVFGSAATDLDYSVLVTDNRSGAAAAYRGNAANPLVSDTNAFPCEP